MTALAAETVGAQPRIVPPSVAKRNLAPVVTPFWLSWNAAVSAFATVPVGLPATVTTVDDFVPAPL